MSNVTSLPNSLILLVHLHLLSYPHANKPEYDDHLFAASRGLRERTKTMEDISYFLIGRLERTKDGPKAIFPTYPCIRPSDTVAFRTSLAKYLEQLRHGSIYSSTSGNASKPKDRQLASKDGSAAWWKDVVVRKSLLEECSGERFERLMLALSTHTLMKLSKSSPISDFFQELIRQPHLYHSNLSRLNSLRQQWTQKALYLNRRAEELERLRTQISDDGRSKGIFQTSTTKQLQELAQSKLRHLGDAFWAGEDGAKALELLLTLAGFSSSPLLQHTLSTLAGEQHSIPNLDSSPLVPLPVAAAHHPSQLKKFRRSIFRPPAPQVERQPVNISSSNADVCSQQYLQTAATVHATLTVVLAQIRTQNEKLSGTLKDHFARSLVSLPPPPSLLSAFDDKLWASLSHCVAEEIGAHDPVAKLEERIEEIRTHLLPPYPVTQDPLPERLPALEPKVKPPSGIPQRLPPQKPTTARQSSNTTSPIKRSPRKSIRFSIARQARPRVSTLRVFSGGQEVNELINSTHDLPSDNDDSDTEFDSFGTPGVKNLKTPKSKPKINRIWTASTPSARPPSTLKNSGMAGRESFPNFLEAAVSLPSLLSAEGFLDAGDGDGYEEEEDSCYVADGPGIGDQLATPRAKGFDVNLCDEVVYDTRNDYAELEEAGYGEEGYEEEESMSLKEMLLSSQANFADLMGTQVGNFTGEDQDGDDSFNWDSLDS